MNKFLPFLFLMIIVLPGYVFADNADDTVMESMEVISDQLKKFKHKLHKGQFDGSDLAVWTKLTVQLKNDATLCSSRSEDALLDLQEDMDGLGEKVKGEDVEVSRKRATYEKEKSQLSKTLVKCNLFAANSEELTKLINHAEKSYFKQKYLVRSPNMMELVMEYLSNPVAIVKDSTGFIFKHSGMREIDALDIALSVMVIVVSIFTGFWLRKKLLSLESKRQWQDDFSENLFRAVITTLAESAPYLLGSLTAAITSVIITLEVVDIPFITELAIGLVIFFLVTAFIRLLFSPSPPAKLFIPFTPHIAESLARRLKVLAVLGLVGFLAFYTVFSESIIESNLMLLRNIFSLFIVVNVVWTLQVIISSPRLPRLRYVTWLVIFAVTATLIAEWLGYRNLAFSGRRVIMFSFIAFVIFIGISKVFEDLFNAMDAGTYAWCRRLHTKLGVIEQDRLPGLFWIRLLVATVIWGAFAILLISIWDYSGGVLIHIKAYIVSGFSVGDFRIVPSQILLAILIFALVVIFSGWVRSQLESNWLRMTNMGQGARDAMVTVIGYVMFVIAVLAGLSVAGFDFSNLAIVAGALSLGIGFGLQNIVNNFVSGLILLFERPIRKGDWIVVGGAEGGTEGVVKDIQIRSTRIQTFDRSDVIVPNSELISNQVTNWVLSSNVGRAIIPVGVAYGSDTEKVRDILLAIAEKNDHVVKTGAFPKPAALFRAFGDSSLNFELRVFLRDVDSRLSVISDINFAIDKEFREAGIEIPFPQRDLHVKTLPEKIRSESGNAEIIKRETIKPEAAKTETVKAESEPDPASLKGQRDSSDR